jgi:hypothetical protein
MKTRVISVLGALLFVASTTTSAQEWTPIFSVQLSGFSEVPSLSTPAKGRFDVRGSLDGTLIQWQLTYEGLAGAVSQAHIHFGQAGVNGGISLFLCSNLGNGPAGTQVCPATATSAAPVTGISAAADIVGPSGQGIPAGGLAKLVEAILAGKGYVNVHSSLYPSGEIRAQLPFGDAAPK